MSDLSLRPSLASEETTALLNRWSSGSSAAGDAVMERLYPDLLRLVTSHCQGWHLTARPSDLAQETFLRLNQQRDTRWADRAHFFAVVARTVRRVLVDQARAQGRQKRGGRTPDLDLAQLEIGRPDEALDVLELHDALERLAAASPSAVRVVELRYFAGLGIDEVAEVLGVGRATVVRRWRFARAWLRYRLGCGVEPGGAD